jgi:hypothetical protein
MGFWAQASSRAKVPPGESTLQNASDCFASKRANINALQHRRAVAVSAATADDAIRFLATGLYTDLVDAMCDRTPEGDRRDNAMNVRRWVLVGVGVWLILMSHPAVAHHGTAMFEMDHLTTIKGSVVDYQLINPHVQITLKVVQNGGNSVDWMVEAVSMNMMMRAGFRRDSVKAGDIVSVTGHPGKNGRTIILLTKIALPDGRELSAPYE